MSGNNQIYTLSFMHSNDMKQNIYDAIRSLPFGEYEKSRLLKIKNPTALKNSLSALICLEHLLVQHGIDTNTVDLTIVRDENGKPHFISCPLHFSISHSDTLAAVVLSDKNVGIDLEFIDSSRDILAISKRFFAPEEHSAICESKYPIEDFFALWTKKEALSKLLGKGLASICATQVKNGIECNFKEYIIVTGECSARLALCHDGDSVNLNIDNPYKEITLYEIQN